MLVLSLPFACFMNCSVEDSVTKHSYTPLPSVTSRYWKRREELYSFEDNEEVGVAVILVDPVIGRSCPSLLQTILTNTGVFTASLSTAVQLREKPLPALSGPSMSPSMYTSGAGTVNKRQ